MALDEALYRWYRPKTFASPVTSTRGREARIRALERTYGSGKAAAQAAGVGPSTWRAWTTKSASRRAPSPMNARKLEHAYGLTIRATRTARILAPTEIQVTAVVVGDPAGAKYKNPKEKRTFRAERDGTPAREAVAEWKNNGSPAAVADAALRGVKSAYGIPFAFEGTDVVVRLV